MFFTVLIMPTSFDSIQYNFSDKLHCSSKSIPCLPCTFNNLSSRSVAVSLLVSWCVGVEEGRCRKSLKEWLHHLHQSIFSNFLDKLANLSLPYYTLYLRAGLWGRYYTCSCLRLLQPVYAFQTACSLLLLWSNFDQNIGGSLRALIL